ncbi:ABC transporter substrate-binding protein [Rugamonas sp.]|uniref:substrate-binding periplasmic protein n=1 Tax=Rugamonas sp. TaxID=1926287 RepID=UPI0025DB75EE|nr:transporter substrate-binding domain-containing protein [Rugamonas sp.]
MAVCPSPVAWLIRATLLSTLIAAAHAETMLYVGNVAPYAYPDGAPRRGLMYELIHETALRAGHSGTVHVVPLRRQIAMLRTQRDSLGSITRLAEREMNYSWPVKLMQEPITLVTRRDARIDISSVDAAKGLRIGVMLGGPAEALARRIGFADIQTTTNTANNVAKLMAGRIDAIVVLGGLFATDQAMSGVNVDTLRDGAVLGRVDVYLAGAPGMAPAEAQKWTAAFQALRRDGGYRRIMLRYHHAE